MRITYLPKSGIRFEFVFSILFVNAAAAFMQGLNDKYDPQTLPSGPDGMDLHPYLLTWSNIEPEICRQVNEDEWQFTFQTKHEAAKPDLKSTITSEVESVYGAGLIEDLIAGCINDRDGWSYTLAFDRREETFTASVSTSQAESFKGLESLNPSIALLTAYLQALKGGS